jgi:MoaA/NifB/PqqE/SkfB family radical SAM enzyme
MGQLAGRKDSLHTLTHADPRHANIVLVDWMLGNRCNFSCDYCPTHLHDGSQPWVDLNQAVDFLRALQAHFSDGLGRQVWLQLTGGEPTQYPHFFDLCAAAKALDIKVGVISNGSRTARFWKKTAKLLASAVLTYHDLQVDHLNFIETLQILEAEGVAVHVNVTAHPDRFDEIMRRKEEILEKSVSATLTVKPLRLNFGTELYPYSESQMRRLAEHSTHQKSKPIEANENDFQRGVMLRTFADGNSETLRPNDLILADENHWRSYRCNAGIESLRVKADGSIFRAVCGSGGVLGHIGQSGLDLPVISVTCDRETCACVSDILITKKPPLARNAQ